MRRIALLSLLLLDLQACYVWTTVDGGYDRAAAQGVFLEVLSVKRVHTPDSRQKREIQLRLRNTTQAPIRYAGYAPDHPIVLIAHHSSIGWVRSYGPTCGTGIFDYDLAPGEEIEFSVKLNRTAVNHLIRVTFWTIDGFQVWSPTIDLDRVLNPSRSRTISSNGVQQVAAADPVVPPGIRRLYHW